MSSTCAAGLTALVAALVVTLAEHSALFVVGVDQTERKEAPPTAAKTAARVFQTGRMLLVVVVVVHVVRLQRMCGRAA